MLPSLPTAPQFISNFLAISLQGTQGPIGSTGPPGPIGPTGKDVCVYASHFVTHISVECVSEIMD